MTPVNHHFFMHIPKTAGTTLRGILESRFDPERTLPSLAQMKNDFGGHYPPIPQLLAMDDQHWESAQLLRGHYPWQVMKRFSRKPVMLTMLREPVARSLSHLRHVKRNARWAVDLSLEQIADRKAFLVANVGNIQTRMLTMRFAMDDPSSFPKDVNQPFAIDDVAFKRAIVTLRSFDFVGIQEHFEASMAQMFHMFGWDMPESFVRANTSESMEQPLSTELLARLTEINDLDLILYREALELFHGRQAQRLESAGESAD
ncbi:MAG: sulfotransferase family 2 domain-containing protein [Lysobacterales bacterium]